MKHLNQLSTQKNPFYEQRQNETKLRMTEKIWKNKI